MESLCVLKFGGTSVKNLARIQHVADIIEKAPEGKKIVVVSAMGDTTDYLLALAKQCTDFPDRRELDQLLVTGEQVSIALLAMTLQARGISCKSFTGPQIGIHTDCEHSSARILDIKSDILQRAIDDYDVVVVAGFQGLSEDGEVTTLGRGGSDTTAVALAAAAGASSCHIYTDVDGVFTSDPRLIDDAALIENIEYGDVLELARCGAQVIHPRAIELAEYYAIDLRVRNTFNPDNQGTKIGDIDMENYQRKCAVAVDNNQALIKLKAVDAAASDLALESVLNLLTRARIDVEMISPTGNSESETLLSIRYADRDQVRLLLQELRESIAGCDLESDLDVCKVSLVGKSVCGQAQTAAQFLSSLQRAGHKPQLIVSNETRISCLLRREDGPGAAAIIHDRFALSSKTETDRTRTRAQLQLTA